MNFPRLLLLGLSRNAGRRLRLRGWLRLLDAEVIKNRVLLCEFLEFGVESNFDFLGQCFVEVSHLPGRIVGIRLQHTDVALDLFPCSLVIVLMTPEDNIEPDSRPADFSLGEDGS